MSMATTMTDFLTDLRGSDMGRALLADRDAKARTARQRSVDEREALRRDDSAMREKHNRLIAPLDVAARAAKGKWDAAETALVALHIRHVPSTTRTRMHEELRGGLSYVRREPGLMGLTFLAFATTCLGTPILTFLPLFAQDVFRGGVGQYTQLMACAGAGAVTGALVVAWRGKFAGMGRTLLLLQLAFGVLVALFAVTRVIWINAGLLFAAGACMIMVFATLSSLVQLTAPNEMRGRVMSIYMVAFRGGMPLGSLVAGYVATLTSAPLVLTVNGVLLSLVAGWFLLKQDGVKHL